MSLQNSSWQIQKDVVFALFLREMKTRFGKFRLGYFWGVLEPLSLVMILSLIRMALGSSAMGGIEFPVFFATGILPFLLFLHSVNVSLYAVDSNIGLFCYRRVHAVDTVVARILLEAVIVIATSVLTGVILSYMGFTIQIDDPLLLIQTVLLLLLFSFGVSLTACVMGAMSNEVQKIIPIILRPLFFISGIFFVVNDIPEPYQELLLLNPMLHVIELFRTSLYSNYTTATHNPAYLAICTLIVCFLSLAYYRVNREKIVTSGTK